MEADRLDQSPKGRVRGRTGRDASRVAGCQSPFYKSHLVSHLHLAAGDEVLGPWEESSGISHKLTCFA